MAAKIKLTLELTEDVNDFLEREADEVGTSKSDVLRKAIALMKVASIERKKKRELAIIDSNSEKVVSRIVGL
ncbi:MAG TPA: hypothetical protein VEA99_05135 [Gemmatimonadaceae bacterium]|jgi:hypothetical protein|nr:hypothetical protein [Gemmatimonadaceae bacterium]